jgi:hypothetical protein
MLVKQVNLLIPTAYLALTAYILVLPFTKTPSELLAAVAVTLSGVPVYAVFVAGGWQWRPCRCRLWGSGPLLQHKNR